MTGYPQSANPLSQTLMADRFVDYHRM